MRTESITAVPRPSGRMPALVTQALELDREVNRLVRKQSTESWLQLNLTVPQLKTLFYVSNEAGTSPSRVAAALHVTRANVTGIIDRLEEQGLLERTENADDRRVCWLRTTTKGEKVLAGLREGRLNSLRKILLDLSSDELKSLVSGLSALARSATVRDETRKAEDPRGNVVDCSSTPLPESSA